MSRTAKIFFGLLAQLLAALTSIASFAGFSCPGVFYGESLRSPRIQEQDIAVDYNMGLIQLMGYDKQTDTAKVFIFDEAYARKLFKKRDEREQLATRPLYIHNFSTRRVAKVGTEESAKIIRSRINDFFGLEHIAIYFGLYPVIQRLRPKSPFFYKEAYTDIIRKYFRERTDADLNGVLKYFRELSFRRFNADVGDSDFVNLYKMILELSAVTNENLFHVGILTTFARPRFNNWVWPVNSGPYSFDSRVWGLVNVRLGVPRDIDHYSRSWVWRETQSAFESDGDLVVDNAEAASKTAQPDEKIFWLRNKFYQLAPERSTLYENFTAQRSRQISSFFLTYSQSDPFWLRMFEVAASIKIKPRFVKNLNVRFILPDTDIGRARRLAEEIKRVGYDGGAKHVEVVIVKSLLRTKS